ncbi:hypothetical protein niasHT_025141 [Heterodera trifolii]|uniref:Uncharacterized protein n=1 Tax=Heterodera trifolii TaxID=157864 RepID=A0ABD2K202_9BILA
MRTFSRPREEVSFASGRTAGENLPGFIASLKVIFKREETYFSPWFVKFAIVSRKYDISAMLVKKMKESAEQFIDGKTVTVAVITVSTYFDESQRHAIKDAGEKSGILDKLLGRATLPEDPQPRPEPYRWPTQAKRAGTSGSFVQLD